MVRFVSTAGRTYRILKESNPGSWLIEYDNPGEPIFISEIAISS